MGRDSDKFSRSNRDRMSITGASDRSEPVGYGSLPSYAYGYQYLQSRKDKSLRDYLHLVFNYKWLILTCTIIGLAAGVLLRHTGLAVYESKALVNIGTYSLPLEGPDAEALRSESMSPEYTNNLIALLNSYAIARRVLINHSDVVYQLFGKDLPRSIKATIDNNSLSSAENLKENHQVFPVHMLDHYLSHIKFRQLEETSLVEVSAKASTPKLAALLANTHAESFIEMVRDQRFVSARTNVDFLKKRYNEAYLAAKNAEQEMISYAQIHSLPISGDIFRDDNSQKYQSLIENLGRAVDERTQSTGELRELTRMTRSSSNAGAVSDKTLPIASRIAELQALKNQLKRSAAGSVHVKNIESEIAGLQRIIRVTAKHEIQQSKIKKRGAEEKERLLRQEITRLRDQEVGKYDTKVQFSLLVREAEWSKDQLASIKQRLDDAVVGAESDQKTVTIVDPAFIPNAPLPEQKASSILSGSLLGFLIGLVLSLILDLHDSSIRTVDDLQDITVAPLLGAIPAFGPRAISEKKRDFSKIPASLRMPSAVSGDSDFSSALDTLVIEGDNVEFGAPIPNSPGLLPIVVRSPLHARVNHLGILELLCSYQLKTQILE